MPRTAAATEPETVTLEAPDDERQDVRDAMLERIADLPESPNAGYVIVHHRAGDSDPWARVGTFPWDWLRGSGPDGKAQALGGGELRYDVRMEGKRGAVTIQTERFARTGDAGTSTSEMAQVLDRVLEHRAGSGGGGGGMGDGVLVALIQSQAQTNAAMFSAMANMGRVDIGGIVQGLAPLLPKGGSERGVDDLRGLVELAREFGGSGGGGGNDWASIAAAAMKGIDAVGAQARAERAEHAAQAMGRRLKALESSRNPNIARNGPQTPPQPPRGSGGSDYSATPSRNAHAAEGGEMPPDSNPTLVAVFQVLQAGASNPDASLTGYAEVLLDLSPEIGQLVLTHEPAELAQLIVAQVPTTPDHVRAFIAEVADEARTLLRDNAEGDDDAEPDDDGVEAELLDDLASAGDPPDDDLAVAGSIGASDGGDDGPPRAA